MSSDAAIVIEDENKKTQFCSEKLSQYLVNCRAGSFGLTVMYVFSRFAGLVQRFI